MLTAFVLFAAYLLFSVFRMQVFEYAKYSAMVKEQITTTSPLHAPRGTIYDANGMVLARSKTVWRIYLSPVDIKNASKRDDIDYAALIAEGLSPLLGVNAEVIRARAEKYQTIDQTVKQDANAEEYALVLAFVKQNKLSDMVHTEATTVREYPQGTMAAHVLGFTGSDRQGLFGLEYQYDSILRGKDGSYLHAKDATGKILEGVYFSYQAASEGHSIVTTLDGYIQSQLEHTVSEIEAAFDVQNRVTGIVMNTKTGAILAMATSSPFDPNDPYTLSELFQQRLADSSYAKDSDDYKAYKNELLYEMWRNKACSELYEPGSTFKIITAAMAYDLGLIRESDRFSCTGGLQIGGYRISCHKKGGHGSGFDFAYGLQQSCNPTLMQIGARIGGDRFHDYFERFGYFEKTGIDLPSEVTAIFHDKDAIGVTELATSSFGQRFKVSVLQQLVAVSAVANGGNLVTPYLVEKVLDQNGKVISEHTPLIKRQVISQDAAKTVAQILEAGVSGDGGARNAYVAGYTVAAKTGTSQKFDILDENGNSYLRIGSCVAFAPAEDSEVAVILVVDEPTTQKYGAIVAAPYISSLMSSVLPYLEVKASGENKVEYETVQELVGLTVSQVKTATRGSALSYRIIGDGECILAQYPASGTVLDSALGSVILYTEDSDLKEGVIPDLLGMNAQDANKAIIDRGFNIEVFGITAGAHGEAAVVTEQSLPPGSTAPLGSVIRVTILCPDDTD